VSFLLPNGAIFEPSLSVGPEEDEVTCLNLAVAGAYSLVPKPLHMILEGLMRNTNSSLFQRRTVKELLWGYHDPILKDTVGLFSPYNGTYDGPYNVFTGKDDISKVNIIDRWQGLRELRFWNDKYCNMINGTDASSFPPSVSKKKPLYFFSSDICRSVSASYEATMNLKGIDLYRFTLLRSTMAAPNVNPDNHCYCTDPLVTKDCTVAGVLDVSPCRDGYPIYISLPHFLYGSPQLIKDVSGLSPSEEHHKTYLDVEPTTGFTMRFAKRLQVNMMYGPSNVITVLKKVKDYTIFPVAWLNETASLDDETADMFKAELTARVEMLETVQQAMLGCGAAIFLGCLIGYVCAKRTKARKSVA